MVHQPFQQFLDEHARVRCDVGSVLERAASAFVPSEPSSFDRPFASLRRQLRELGRVCARGLERTRKARREIDRCVGESRQVQLLRSVGRSQDEIHAVVSEVSLLDSVVQRELLEVSRTLGQVAGGNPSPAQVASEAETLMDATRQAVQRSAELIDALEREIGGP